MAFPIAVILRIVKAVLALFPLPDWTVSTAVQAWVLKVLGIADELADLSTTTIDDEAIEAAKGIVSDPESWALFYSILADLFNHDAVVELVETDARVAKLAADAKISPAVIIVIIQAVYMLYKWWK